MYTQRVCFCFASYNHCKKFPYENRICKEQSCGQEVIPSDQVPLGSRFQMLMIHVTQPLKDTEAESICSNMESLDLEYASFCAAAVDVKDVHLSYQAETSRYSY